MSRVGAHVSLRHARHHALWQWWLDDHQQPSKDMAKEAVS